MDSEPDAVRIYLRGALDGEVFPDTAGKFLRRWLSVLLFDPFLLRIEIGFHETFCAGLRGKDLERGQIGRERFYGDLDPKQGIGSFYRDFEGFFPFRPVFPRDGKFSVTPQFRVDLKLLRDPVLGVPPRQEVFLLRRIGQGFAHPADRVVLTGIRRDLQHFFRHSGMLCKRRGRRNMTAHG